MPWRQAKDEVQLSSAQMGELDNAREQIEFTTAELLALESDSNYVIVFPNREIVHVGSRLSTILYRHRDAVRTLLDIVQDCGCTDGMVTSFPMHGDNADGPVESECNDCERAREFLTRWNIRS